MLLALDEREAERIKKRDEALENKLKTFMDSRGLKFENDKK